MIQFKRMGSTEQFIIFLLFLSPFFIILLVQLFMQHVWRHWRIRHQFYNLAKEKKLDRKELNFLMNILTYLKMPLRPEYFRYDFQFWRMVILYTQRASEKQGELPKILTVLANLKFLGKKIFGRIPNRFFSTADLLEKQDVSLEFPRLKIKIHGFLVRHEEKYLIFQAKDFPVHLAKMAEHERVSIIVVNPSQGIYFFETRIHHFEEGQPLWVCVEHSVQVLFRNLRRFERFTFWENLQMMPMDSSALRYQKAVKGYFSDISRGGAKIYTAERLMQSESFILHFEHNGTFQLPAIIVGESFDFKRREQAYHLKYINLTAHEKNVLDRLLQELKEREAG